MAIRNTLTAIAAYLAAQAAGPLVLSDQPGRGDSGGEQVLSQAKDTSRNDRQHEGSHGPGTTTSRADDKPR
jgi:hypothetical protein